MNSPQPTTTKLNDSIQERIKILSHHLMAGNLGSSTQKTTDDVNSSFSGSSATTLVTRRLARDDFDKGFLELLGQLTSVGNVSREQFEAQYDEVSSNPVYALFVIEDTARRRIVACATLLIEKKFIHSCGAVGHIEDVVVDKTCRGHDLGRKIIEALKQEAQDRGCYKTILDCSEKNTPFYEKCGFKTSGVQMRFDHPH